MIKIIRSIILYLIILLFVPSCEVESEKLPAEQLIGKWVISSTELLTQKIPGDGSYLQFDKCSTLCSGIDYDASEGTTGNFTYKLNENASVLNITDSSSSGGNYNFTWDILELSDSKLIMIANTGLFGTLRLELIKQ